MYLSKEELGKLIKSARKLKGESIQERYTQEMLAKDIGISRSYLGDIESGRTYPNYVLLNKIAEACNVPFSFFGDTNGIVLEMVKKAYPGKSENEQEKFTDYVCKNLKDPIGRTIDLDTLKIIYDSYKELNLQDSIDYGYDNNDNFEQDPSSKETDVKQAMEIIISQPGLMLNGEMLSDESKMALANAIKMGLAYAEQMQQKEKYNTKGK